MSTLVNCHEASYSRCGGYATYNLSEVEPNNYWTVIVVVGAESSTLTIAPATHWDYSPLRNSTYRSIRVESDKELVDIKGVTLQQWQAGHTTTIVWETSKIRTSPTQVFFRVTFSTEETSHIFQTQIEVIATRLDHLQGLFEQTDNSVQQKLDQCLPVQGLKPVMDKMDELTKTNHGLTEQVKTLQEENETLTGRIEDQKKTLEVLLESCQDDTIHFLFPDDPSASKVKSLEACAEILSHYKSFSSLIKKHQDVKSINETESTLQVKISVEGFKQATFHSMLYFLYTGEVEFSDESETNLANGVAWEDLFILTDCYNIPVLREICRQRMIDRLSIENSIDTLFRIGMCFDDIKEPAMVFILNNYETFFADKNHDPFDKYLTQKECLPLIKELMHRSASKLATGSTGASKV